MQKLLITFIILISLPVTGQNQETHQLNNEQSVINWKGTYAFNISEHKGTVNFKKGELITNDGNITGGEFVIDMKSISNEEYLNSMGPVKHLRDTDFFDVNKFPEAKLVITSVEYFSTEKTHRILADLTIKGITKPIKFHGEVDTAKKLLTTRFKIDRTRWGITYNNRLKNDAIAEGIEFNVNLQF